MDNTGGPQWQACPTPEKIKFLDDAGAAAHVQRLRTTKPPKSRRAARKIDPATQEHRAYDCRCGFVHITTKGGGRPICPASAEPATETPEDPATTGQPAAST